MIARQYDKRIKIYGTTTVSDGFGGNTTSEVLIGSFWAEIKQNSAFRDTAIGMSNIKRTTLSHKLCGRLKNDTAFIRV